jgi:hypothetical protein
MNYVMYLNPEGSRRCGSHSEYHSSDRSGKLLEHTQTSQPEDVTAWCHTASASASASADKVHPSVFDITVIASVSLVTQTNWNRTEHTLPFSTLVSTVLQTSTHRMVILPTTVEHSRTYTDILNHPLSSEESRSLPRRNPRLSAPISYRMFTD